MPISLVFGSYLPQISSCNEAVHFSVGTFMYEANFSVGTFMAHVRG